jgi:hypothetical protein
MSLISFGIYTVVVLLVGVFIGASLTYRRQQRQPPVPSIESISDLFKLNNVETESVDEEPDGGKKDEAKRWSA